MSLLTRHPRLLVITAVVAAFASGWGGDFVFDDVFEIEHNAAMRRLWPPWEAMTVGNRLPARLLPSWSFAIDHAVWGDDPHGYHFANILIHAIAAVALYDVARRTLAAPRLRDLCHANPGVVAVSIAVIWAVHPLQTQAVTYIYQRIESMAGMFSLLSLACFARAASQGFPTPLLAGCLAAAAAAMASKESAIVLPLVILTYDWTFWAEPPAAIRRRWRFYAALVATTAIVGLQLWLQRTMYGEFRDTGPGSLAYALTQPGVILHYLRLAAWPTGQCLDYDWPIVSTTAEAILPLAVVCTALAATGVGVVKRRPWAWLASAFFLTLAPTSSIMPVLAPAAEHRMYLPLASLSAGVAWGLAVLCRRRDAGPRSPAAATMHAGPDRRLAVAAIGLAVLLGLATRHRNDVYRSREGMWQDVIAKRPENFVAWMWMAGFAYGRGDEEGAIRHADAAVALRPTSTIYRQIAEAARGEGRLGDAERLLRRYLDLTRATLPTDSVSVLSAQAALAETLVAQQRQDEAEALCRRIVDRLDARAGAGNPATVECRTIMVRGLLRSRKLREAVSLAAANHDAAAKSLGAWHPVSQRAASAHALALEADGDLASAERVLRETLLAADGVAWRRTVDSTPAREALSRLLESTGRFEEAIQERRRILEVTQSRPEPEPMATARAQLALMGAEAAGARQQGRAADEEVISRSAMGLARRMLGDGDPLTQRVVVNHAAVLLRAGKPAEADRLLQDRLHDADSVVAEGGRGDDRSILRSGLADLYERTGRLDESLELRRRVLRDCLARHGETSEVTRRAAAAAQATDKAAQQRRAAGQPAAPGSTPEP